ncbi:glycosyltransferase family 50 protein [Armillaria novae-zelandiae]|uniref:GPI mannosyltransferase 1 n=1 Tax=Armillaria novae-zelandiae TaxID=153914 RepID=A0AA39PH87_9AGAR|nr:glycosyltransferase family 50 protein [Armillaria novae-zelandiae]
MAIIHIIPYFSSFRHVLILSVAIRVVLIIYSEWHDARSLVKYTDIDYRVFSDAASFLLHPGERNVAQGPLKSWIRLGDPYTRETYRYTPLLALLLAPNEWIHPSFGKYLFAACDIINGLLIHRLTGATRYSALHMLNPMVFSISTRGSSESVLSLLVLLTLYAALTDRWKAAAVMLGVSTHWKIYPGIYGVACLAVLAKGNSIVNWRGVSFGLLSVLTFGIIGAGCYLVWGYPFLYESYLYHLHRLDHRHNFSPYFYLTYLTYQVGVPENSRGLFSRVIRSPLTSFLPQMTLVLVSGLALGRRKDDLVFACFIQTAVFVIFNKVCTSQYFLWYLLLLPLLLPSIRMSTRKAFTCLAVWIGVQALWLSEAYKLEFLGQNVFLGLWLRGLVYIVGNCWVLAEIMNGYKSPTKKIVS